MLMKFIHQAMMNVCNFLIENPTKRFQSKSYMSQHRKPSQYCLTENSVINGMSTVEIEDHMLDWHSYKNIIFLK